LCVIFGLSLTVDKISKKKINNYSFQLNLNDRTNIFEGRNNRKKKETNFIEFCIASSGHP